MFSERLTSALKHCSGGIRSVGEIGHYQHDLFGQRAGRLAVYLEAVLSLTRENLYGPAFAVVRAGLEHHIFDQLLFLGDRYEQVITNVNEETWEKWQEDRASGVPGMDDIIDLTRSKTTVRVARRGPMLDDDTQRTLSQYYWLYTDHDPFVGPRSAQEGLAGQFTSLDQHRELAQRYEDMRAGRLNWSNLKNNIALNQLMSGRELNQLDVHYRFLSAFVHPTSQEAERRIYGGNSYSSPGEYDHFSSELVLLYVVAIGSQELLALEHASQRDPRFEMPDWPETRRLVLDAQATISYFWWPGGTPHWFDRVQEANDRGIDHKHDREFVPREERSPESIPEREVGYYRDPLLRLIAMHTYDNELTGFLYEPPWPPRRDPLRRA